MPVLFVVAALLLSVVTVAADEFLFGLIPESALFRGDADSGRSMLTSIASASITLTGLVFSVTMLVLQLTGVQYSPRAVGALIGDRNSKYTLGVFVATFTYSLAVLRTIDADEGGDFDRGISVAVAVILALVTVAFFIQYVNHVARQIRPASIIGRVAHEAQRAIDAHFPDKDAPDMQEDPPRLAFATDHEASRPLPSEQADRLIEAPKAGIVRTIDAQGLMARAKDEDMRIQVVPGVGAFVPEGAPLLRCWGAPGVQADDDGLAGYVTLGGERNMVGDPLYGFRQLVDIAERALSPGTNDPTTAVQAIDQIHHLLRRIVRRPIPNGIYTDDRGRTKVVVPEPDWQDLLDLAIDEVAHYGEDSHQVRGRLVSMLEDLKSVAPPERVGPIVDKLTMVQRTMRDSPDAA